MHSKKTLKINDYIFGIENKSISTSLSDWISISQESEISNPKPSPEERVLLNLFFLSLNNKSIKKLSSGDGLGFEISDLSDIDIQSETFVDMILFSMPKI